MPDIQLRRTPEQEKENTLRIAAENFADLSRQRKKHPKVPLRRYLEGVGTKREEATILLYETATHKNPTILKDLSEIRSFDRIQFALDHHQDGSEMPIAIELDETGDITPESAAAAKKIESNRKRYRESYLESIEFSTEQLKNNPAITELFDGREASDTFVDVILERKKIEDEFGRLLDNLAAAADEKVPQNPAIMQHILSSILEFQSLQRLNMTDINSVKSKRSGEIAKIDAYVKAFRKRFSELVAAFHKKYVSGKRHTIAGALYDQQGAHDPEVQQTDFQTLDLVRTGIGRTGDPVFGYTDIHRRLHAELSEPEYKKEFKDRKSADELKQEQARVIEEIYTAIDKILQPREKIAEQEEPVTRRKKSA